MHLKAPAVETPFSYHYGDWNGLVDSDGYPEQIAQVDLRIDKESSTKYPDHIHYAGENHVACTRVMGLDFEAITPFDFIRAVLEHRNTSKHFSEILGFEVLPMLLQPKRPCQHMSMQAMHLQTF